MSSLSLAVTKAHGTGRAALKEETKALATTLLGYASTLSRQAGPIARLAGHLGVPGGQIVGETLEATSKAINSLGEAKTPLQLKQELSSGLEKLNRRIVVIIDDLDRLEPQEAAEITRLIRAVANFPNITYILCYDPHVLSSHLEKVVSVDDGAAFLEKIVQVSFTVPQPEVFDLRRWLLEECVALYNPTVDGELSEEKMRRVCSVCDVDGNILRTPRDVVRIINAIKLHWRPVSDNVDYADLVWLQIIKSKNKKLYALIDHYLMEYAALADGASIDKAHRVEIAKKLKEHLTEGGPTDPLSMWRIKQFIPGLRTGRPDGEGVFNRESDTLVASLERERRLGSSQHSRYHFAFSKPGGALEDAEIKNFVSSAQGGGSLDEICMALRDAKRPQGDTKFELLIDRLNRLDDVSVSDDAVPSILMAVADNMDKVGGKDRLGGWAWESAEALFKRLVRRLSSDRRRKVVREVFASGESIGWLMNVIRHEIWGHGWVGDRAVLEANRLLTEQELKRAIKAMLGRFASADRQRLVETPNLLSSLYGWKEAGDKDGVLAWVREQAATDSGFLSLLSGCRGWVYSGKVYHPLNRGDLSHFLDLNEILVRLRRIAEDSDKKEERRWAKELLEAAELGKAR